MMHHISYLCNGFACFLKLPYQGFLIDNLFVADANMNMILTYQGFHIDNLFIADATMNIILNEILFRIKVIIKYLGIS